MIEITGLTDGDRKAVVRNTKLDLLREGLVRDTLDRVQLARLGQVVALNMGSQYRVASVEQGGPGHCVVRLNRLGSDVTVTFDLDFMGE